MLSEQLLDALPDRGSVLDVGCGDGSIDALVQSARPELAIQGIDVLVRPVTKIKVTPFDGVHIPFPDRSFESIMFVDVLHHTENPTVLLAEACRVARRSVVVKDHLCESPLAQNKLRLMDWVGNAHHGVELPYNYWSLAQWTEAFNNLNLKVETWQTELGLYPWPASLLFERGLHFVARLAIADQ
jgi:SAM-dependent methyltransferase